MKNKVIEYLHNTFIQTNDIEDFVGKTPYLVIQDEYYIEIATYFAIKMNISVVYANYANKELTLRIDQPFKLSNLIKFFDADNIFISSVFGDKDETTNIRLRIVVA